MEDKKPTRLPDDAIDNLFKSGLKGHQVVPEGRVWKGINRRLLFRELCRFQFTHLTRHWWVGIFSGMVILVAVVFLLTQQNEESLSTTHPISHDTVQVGKKHTEAMKKLTGTDEIHLSSDHSASATQKDQTIDQQVPHQQAHAGNTPVASVLTVPPTPIEELSHEDDLLASGVNAPGFIQSQDLLLSLMRLQSLVVKSLPTSHPEHQVLPVSFRQPPSFIQPVVPRKPLQIYGMLHFTPDLMFYRDAANYYKYQYTFGLTGGLHHGRWYGETGVSLSLSSDIGRYQVDYIQNDSIGYYDQVLSYSVNPANPGEVIFNTTKQTVFDSVNYLSDLHTKNRYTYLRVPLTVGYYLINQEKIRLGLNGGIAVSFMISRNEPEPIFYAPDARKREIQTLTHKHLPVNWMVAAGLRLEYVLTPRLMFLLEPGFGYYLKGIEEVNAVSAQQPHAIGLKAGLKLNSKKSTR